MKRLIAVCALPRLAATVAGIVRVDRSVAVVVDSGQLGDTVRPIHRLVDASDHARARGVCAGQRLLDAQRHAPDLQAKIVNEKLLRAEVIALAEVLLALSPIVEPLLPRDRVAMPVFAIAVDVTGLPRSPARIMSDLARATASVGHRSVVALSTSKALSLAVARDMVFRPGHYKHGAVEVTAQIRDGVAIDALDVDLGLVDSLRATGVRTLADLRPLIDQGLVTRLGSATRAVLPLLADDDQVDDAEADRDGVIPWRPTEVVGASRELEHPITSTEPLLFVLRPLVETIVRRLQARGERLLELAVLLGRRGREPAVVELTFPTATGDISVILRVLAARLDAFFIAHSEHVEQAEDHLLAAGIDRLTMVARRTAKAQARQLGLIGDDDGDVIPEAVAQLLAELTAEHGASRVGVLTTTRASFPEDMDVLAWPPLPPLDVLEVPRRRRPRPVPLDHRTREGRFTAGWPWPLRLLPRPRPLTASVLADVVDSTLFAVLQGDDTRGPWRRHYRVLTLTDGRRALVLVDDEAGDTELQGWFD